MQGVGAALAGLVAEQTGHASLPERAPARHYLNQTVSFQLAKRFRDRVPRHPVLSGQGTHRRKGLPRSPLTSLNPAAQVGLNTP